MANRFRRQRIGALLAVLILTLGAACGTTGTGGEPDSVSVALDWYPWSNHAGLVLAQRNGAFRDAGLDVRLNVPANPEDVLKLVAGGQDTFGISYQTDVLLAREQGIPVRSIMALVQHPLNTVMTLVSSGIERPGQLAGKRVGYPGLPSDEALLATMLEADGAHLDDVELVNVGFDLVPALLGGRVDAIVGAYWVHEAILAERQGYDVNVMRVEDWGVPDYYELVLVASDATIEQRPELVKRFVTAVATGYDAAAADHQGAIDALVSAYPDTDRSLEETGIERLAPLWHDGVPRFGWQTSERWDAFLGWMRERRLIGSGVDAADAFTNQFVESE